MSEQWKKLDLRAQPGHFARRVHQLAVALFAQEVSELGLTPVQYSSLQTICDQPGIDQKTLATTIGYDTSTIGGVIDRLEARGLVARNVSPLDRRARLITPTRKGEQVLQAVVPRMLKAQQRLLAPLAPVERKEFMRLMKLLIDANTELSNIPTRE
ncbi:MarR family winged helix-turn-helix transcriptional regulator [Piscinibacter sp.]|uniref:MarR family winged helix-turn-helix transcriptional regulator n=1 Tax=Piscinibacter sp. TaxID=1903157 RepID=UPI0039E3CD2C